ncbi:Noc2p family-domain-containing protein [Delphinella strobiligena]|nr:Noc2p family-domain-containing protein [Delphinella strobiligena]
MAQSKATKKFEKNRLSDTLKSRKSFAKTKQRHQLNTKKKERRAKDNEKADGVEEEKPKVVKDTSNFESMNVDDFFQGGFDVPELPKAKAKDEKSKKRKRVLPAAAAEDTEASSDNDQPLVTGADDSDADSDDENFDLKAQMAALAEKDPEFYKSLQEDDPGLLNFEDADLGEIDELSGSDAEEEEQPKKKKAKKAKKSKIEEEDSEDEQPAGNELTKAMIGKWAKAMSEQNSLRAAREIAIAFRAAAHVADDDDKEYKYSVNNPEAYHELLVIALKHIPTVLAHHLPIKEKSNGKVTVPTDSKKYRSLTPLLKSHTTSLLHLLANLSDAATLRLTLSSLTPLLPYILSFKKLLRDLIKTVVGIWSDSSNTEAGRITAFLVLRRLMVIGDAGIREATLKATYQGLIKGSRNTTVHTISGINLMKNSAAELWGIDPTIGYTTGFTFIRQLAIHLRGSITNNSKESYKTVYNWQYVHSLDFWSRVLAAHCDSLSEATNGGPSALRPLIYPAVQVTMGAMRLIPTSTYFPLRFHLIRSLLRISLSTGTYIPLGASLYEVLNSAEMRKPPKNSTNKPLDFATTVRAPKSYLRTRVYQDGVGEQVQELFAEFFVLWSKNIAFPELCLPVVVLLKRWLKDVGPHSKHPNQNTKLSSAMLLLCQKLDTNTKWIEERRAKVEFAPNDRAGVGGFLKDTEWQQTPLGAYVVGQRKQREAKEKVLEDARREDEKKREEEKAEKRAAKGKEHFDDEEEEEDVDSEDDGDGEIDDADIKIDGEDLDDDSE